MADLDRRHKRLETPDGQRVAVVYTKVHHRLLRPLIAANTPTRPTTAAPSTPGDRPPH